MRTPPYSAMLVEFRFANFRSYRDEQVFSMGAYVRAPDGLEEAACRTGRKDLPPLLKTAFILGPNGSGKSNLIAAFAAMQRVVRTSAEMTMAPERAPAYDGHDPFIFDEGIQKEPTFFEVTLELDGVRWQYGFSCGAERIEEEYLVAYSGVSPRVYFERIYVPEEEAYAVKYGPHFKGRRKAWEEATRADALFLPTAAVLGAEQLNPVWTWLTECLIVHTDGVPLKLEALLGSPSARARAIRLLASADFTAATIEPEGIRHHPGGPIVPWARESAGLKRLLALAAPLLLADEKNGKEVPDVTIITDDADQHLHPKLLEALVGFWQRERDAAHAPQWIGAVHRDSLLELAGAQPGEASRLRRDQIWMCAKDVDEASRAVPLVQWKVRRSEAVYEGYRKGRYESLPMIEALSLR